MKNLFLAFLAALLLQACAFKRDLSAEAYKYIEQQQYHKAIDAYEQLLAKKPGDARYHFNLAYALMKLKRYTEAEEALNNVILLVPSYPDSYLNRGVCRLYRNKLPEAIADFDKAIELNPESKNAYLNRADVYLRTDKCERSISDLNKALRLGADSAYVYYKRGVAYGACKQYDKAIEDLDFTVRLWPDSHYVKYNRAFAYLRGGQYAGSIRDFKICLEKQIHTDTALATLGFLHTQLPDTAQALSYLDRAINVNPKYTRARLLRAEIWMNRKEAAAALADLDDVLRYNDTCFRALVLRHNIYAFKGETEKAAADQEKMFRLKPADVHVRFERFVQRTAQEDYVGALEEINACLAIIPNEKTFHRNKIRLLFTLYRWDELLPAINSAEYYGFRDDTLLINKSAAFSLLNQRDSAIYYAEQAVAFNPDISNSGRYLYLVYKEYGKKNEATKLMNNFLSSHPRDTFFLWERAQFHKYGGYNEKALADLNALLEQTSNSDALIMRGHILRGKQQYAAAAADYGKAAERNPGESTAWLYRGDCYDLLGKKSLACADWKRACSLGNREGCNHTGSECR